MSPFVIIALNALSSLAKMKQDHTFDHLKADIDKLIAALKPVLPAKVDGSDWTDADVEAAKAAADINWAVLKSITGG